MDKFMGWYGWAVTLWLMETHLADSENAGLAAIVDFDLGAMKMADIPMAGVDDAEDFVVKGAFDFEFVDEVAAELVYFAVGEDLDKVIPAGWPDPAGAAVGDEHVGGRDEILAQDEALGWPTINARNEIHAVDADGTADEKPGLAVDEEPRVIREEFEMRVVHAAIEERGIRVVATDAEVFHAPLLKAGVCEAHPVIGPILATFLAVTDMDHDGVPDVAFFQQVIDFSVKTVVVA